LIEIIFLKILKYTKTFPRILYFKYMYNKFNSGFVSS